MTKIDILGLSLSATVKALLKQSEEDIKAGRLISFKNGHDALAYLQALIAKDVKYA